jgi:hypothetical protein
MNRTVNCPGVRFLGILALLVTLTLQAAPVRRWDFNKTGDLEGWTVAADNRGVVMGGSLWVSLQPEVSSTARPVEYFQSMVTRFPGPDAPSTKIISPAGLNFQVSDSQQAQIHMRVLNLSPVTDFFLQWSTREQTEGYSGSHRCTMTPERKEWQEVTCFIDSHWRGMIDRLAIGIPKEFIRGDLWIDWMEIGEGPLEPARSRPDIASPGVVPTVKISGISQESFVEAFKVLDTNLFTDVPARGFTFPFILPGDAPNVECWWEEDSTLAVTGAKWTNQRFAEDFMRGMRDVQAENPDGRIDAEGDSPLRGQVGDVSALPVLFELAYDVARRTNDIALREEIYVTMKEYLDWWLSPVKRDALTGLVSGVYEENGGSESHAEGNASDKFADTMIPPQSVAPVHLNVFVAVGAERTAEIALSLGRKTEANKYRAILEDISGAINTYLWDEKDGVYYNYDLRIGRLRKQFLSSATFAPLKMHIAPPSRRDRLIRRLLDPPQFNWGKFPVASHRMTDVVHGVVWGPPIQKIRSEPGVATRINMIVVSGLEDEGEALLAAELNWATIREFQGKHFPTSLTTLGAVQQGSRLPLAITAAQYIVAIVEHLFGIDFDAIQKRVQITPHVPRALYGKDIALDNLILPNSGGSRLSVLINQTGVGRAKISVRITGELPADSLVIALPSSAKVSTGPAQRLRSVTFH